MTAGDNTFLEMSEEYMATLPVVGKGRTSTVYDLGDEIVLKLMIPSLPFTKIKQEFELTRTAHKEGLPVPDAYDLVRVGESYGITLDYIRGDVFEDRFRADVGGIRDYIRKFAKAVRELHQIQISNTSCFPDVREQSISIARQLPPEFCSQDDTEKLCAIFECIPPSTGLVHGDCHTKNAILDENRVSFIDLYLCGKGHPVFDLLCMYSHFVVIPSFISKEKCVEQFGFDQIVAEELYKCFLEDYYPSISSKKMEEIHLQIKGVYAARICLAVVLLPGVFPKEFLDKAKESAIRFYESHCYGMNMEKLFQGV